MREMIERFLSFTTSEKRAIILLVVASVMVLIVPRLYLHYWQTDEVYESEFPKEVAAFEKEWNERKHLALLRDSLHDDSAKYVFNPYGQVEISPRFTAPTKAPIEYFYFDPNKIGVEEWKKLGFSERQANGIENAKRKGFKFYKPEDLKRIYVVGEENYARLVPYIRIEMIPKPEHVKTVYSETSRPKFVIDINTADSSVFERQKGIGPSLASRIIRRRERLGGFISVDQIKEVWGMPDSVFLNLKETMTVNNPTVKKLNINTSDFNTMRAHPYINYTYARVIEAYRKEHGMFTTTEGLKKIPVITDSIYKQMLPYITAP